MTSATPAVRPKPAQPDELWINLMFIAAIAGVIISIAIVIAPVVATALVTLFVVKLFRIPWWWIALGAVVLFALVHILGHPPLETIEQSFRKANRLAQRQGFGDAVSRIWEHKAKWWSRTVPALPIGAFLGSLVATLLDARYPIFDPRAEIQRANEVVVSRQKAAKRMAKAPDDIKGLAVLGPFAHGDLAKPWVQRLRLVRYLCLHPLPLGRHAVVVGKPGSGKTTTLLRLAYLAAKVYGWRVYFLDGKGDHPTMREFVALMVAAGVPEHEIGAFPVKAFDGWRTSGDHHEAYSQLLNRLMGSLSFTEPYYRDSTRRYLAKALRMDQRLPRSSIELLERLERLAEEAPAEVKREARTAHGRYESLFGSFSGQLDGTWSFSDRRAGYVLLKGLANRDEAQNLAGYLFECFKQFATDMKPSGDKVLLIVDEFPALMRDSDAAGMIERLRSFGCGVALSGQNYEGLGPDRGRIIEAAGTLILHRLSDSDDLARLAGTVQEFAVTTQVDFNDGATGRGTVTPEHRFKVDPNVIGRQRDGEITVIADRCAGHGFLTKTNPEVYLALADELLARLRAESSPSPTLETPGATNQGKSTVVELR